MEVVEVIFWSSIGFTVVLVASTMIFVRRAIHRRLESERQSKDREELIETLEDVVMSQDKVLGQYRKILD